MENLFNYIAFFAGTLFVAMGVAVLFTDWVPETYGYYKTIIAVVLILYGLYRIIMTYSRMKNNKRDRSIL